MLRSRLMSVSEGKPMPNVEPKPRTDKQQQQQQKQTTNNESVQRKYSTSSSQASTGLKAAFTKRTSTAGLPGADTASNGSNSQPRLSLPSTKGPSLIGLFASKRLAKQLTSRVRRRRYGSMCDSSRTSSVPKKEPSYRMEPARKFDANKVEECIKSVMEDKLQNFPYNPKFCANMSKILCDEIKGEVKMLNFERYKIVCTVLIGQRKDQGTQVASRCAWNEKLDSYASYTFMNEKIFSTAVVYGVYAE